MSDSVSSASRTIATNLTRTTDCTVSNLKVLLAFIMVMLFLCVFMSFIAIPPTSPCCSEHFSNQDMYTYKKHVPSVYNTASLTPLDNDVNAPSHMMFGEAKRMSATLSNVTEYYLDIVANLYILGGNVHSKGDPPVHYYNAYLTQGQDQVLVGKLERDGDKLYKLKVKSDNPDVMKSDGVRITYFNEGEEKVVLHGNFA